MNKKIIISSVCIIVLLVIGIGGYIVYQNKKEGTPEYSLKQLQQTVAAHDTTDAAKYIDEKTIANNIWPRFLSDISQLPENSSAVTQAQFASQQSSTVNTIEQSFYTYITGQNNHTIVGEVIDAALAAKPNEIKIIGDNASIPITITAKDYQYGINVVLTKQKENYWMITDMQKLEVPMEEDQRDSQRMTDLQAMGAGLQNYYTKKGSYPTGVTSWSDFEKDLVNVGTSGYYFENDPLAEQNYPYYYGSNANGTKIILGVVYENPLQSLMLQSYTGALPDGISWQTGTPPEQCGVATTFCFLWPK